MRHRVPGNRIGRPADQRKATLRALATEFSFTKRLKQLSPRQKRAAQRREIDHQRKERLLATMRLEKESQ